MNSSFDWFKYNSERNKEAIKINLHNKRSNINFFEKGHYNHIRDIYALTLLLLKNNKNNTILDFGGNLIVHANLINKININNFFFYIFNPHITAIKKKLSFKFKLIFNEKNFINKKFDFLYFGSSLQYINNFNLLHKLKFIEKSKYILITHTPISFNLKNKFILKQNNQKNLFQNIYSYKFINNKILKNKFKLIFKSVNDHKYSGLKKKYKSVYSMNMLFEKKLRVK